MTEEGIGGGGCFRLAEGGDSKAAGASQKASKRGEWGSREDATLAAA